MEPPGDIYGCFKAGFVALFENYNFYGTMFLGTEFIILFYGCVPNI